MERKSKPKNLDNLHNVRREASRHFRKKTKAYLKAKIEEHETNSMIKVLGNCIVASMTLKMFNCLELIHMTYIGQASRNLKQRYREHIHYIRNNEPQSAYAQHILRNQHEYGSIADTMTQLKPIHKMSMLTTYEQLFIQTYHHN